MAQYPFIPTDIKNLKHRLSSGILYTCFYTCLCTILIASGFYFSAKNNPVYAQTADQTSDQTRQILAQATAGTTGPGTTPGNAAADELRRKIEEQAKNIEELNKEIATYSALKDKTTNEAKTLQGLIKNLDDNAKVLDLDIKKTQSQISKANLEINSLDANIKTSEEKIDDYRYALASSIRQIEQAEQNNIIETLLAQRDLSEALADINDRMNFNSSVKEQVDLLHKEKTSLISTKQQKEDKKEELKDFQSELSDKKKVVEVNKNEKAKVLKETKNQEQTYQAILNDKIAKKAAFEKELFSYESALKYTLDPSSIPKAGSAVFSWPLDKVTITQRFGKTSASGRLYVSGSHNGADFGAALGTPVRAMLSGKVVGTGDTDITCPRASFGRWILVEHSNGLSVTFGHLSSINVKKGDVVGTGQIIGYSGNTGYSTGPHLHISVYASNAVKVEDRPSASCKGKVYTMPIAPVEAYLDPLVYLPANP